MFDILRIQKDKGEIHKMRPDSHENKPMLSGKRKTEDITAESAFPRGTENHRPHNMERYTETTALRTALRKDKDDTQREERVYSGEQQTPAGAQSYRKSPGGHQNNRERDESDGGWKGAFRDKKWPLFCR